MRDRPVGASAQESTLAHIPYRMVWQPRGWTPQPNGDLLTDLEAVNRDVTGGILISCSNGDLPPLAMRTVLLTLLALAASGCADVQQLARDTIDGARPTTYETSQGQSVRFLLGAVAFADRIDRFSPTRELGAQYSDPSQVLGTPEYATDSCPSSSECYLSLTSGGSIVLEFVDNTLYDGDGDDLAVFEIGPDVESTAIAVSVDGVDYIEIGRVEGASATLDIGGRGPAGARYRFVRLTDDPDQGDRGGRTPGADIDAVGAIHAERR